MTSTSIKDVGSVYAGMLSAQGAKGVSSTGDFQKIWDAQMNKGTSDNTPSAANRQSKDVEKQEKPEATEDISKPEEPVKAEKAETKEVAKQEPEEFTEDELREAMEAVGAAAMEMMQKVADAFGISVEELQAAMDALGMEQTDVLDVSALNKLLLNLGGATDSSALVTDEGLYNTYKELMSQLENVLQECADEFGVEPKQLLDMIEQELNTAANEDGLDVADFNVQGESELAGMQQDGADTQTVMKQDNQQMSGDGKEAKEENTSETPNQNISVTAQHGTTERIQPQIQQAQDIYTSNPWDTDTQDIMRQIMDFMKVQVDADTTSLEMQLHPESLGTLQVNVSSKGGVVTANFIAQNEAVKAALETQMIQLKENFAEQGVKVEAIEVTVQTHTFERNLEQGRGRQQQETEKKNRTRRINLGDPMSLEDIDEEDSLRAEMLVADGSTVDYTA